MRRAEKPEKQREGIWQTSWSWLLTKSKRKILSGDHRKAKMAAHIHVFLLSSSAVLQHAPSHHLHSDIRACGSCHRDVTRWWTRVCLYVRVCVFAKVSMKRSYNRAVISSHTYTSKQERGAASASDFPEVQIAHPQMHPGYVAKQHG